MNKAKLDAAIAELESALHGAVAATFDTKAYGRTSGSTEPPSLDVQRGLSAVAEALKAIRED